MQAWAGSVARLPEEGARLVVATYCAVAPVVPVAVVGVRLWKLAVEENETRMPSTLKARVGLICVPFVTNPGAVSWPGPWKVKTARLLLMLA